jgi:hypothetical protein
MMTLVVALNLGLLLGTGVVVSADPPPNEDLQAIRGLRILVESLPKEAEEEHITSQMFSDQIFVALRGKAPRLQVQPTSAYRFPTLYANLGLVVNTRTYAGHLSLEVHRPVELLIGYDSELCSQTFFGGPSAGQSTPPTCKRVFTTATVWSEAFTLLGPRGARRATSRNPSENR